ncbi:MAG TPA: hypothetical protein VL913_01265, partial [Candidatus Micrarchaeaceae archaeon]|nr:hypothetical protein [Candidatus Micrarchaeaceae archaeon]
LPNPVPVMGQWYLRPAESESAPGRALSAEDATDIEFQTQELNTQPAFPPALIEYQAGWYTPGDDDRPPESPAENTLLSSRLLIAGGLRGLNYFPLQDTFSPAGYSVPWANRSYRWNAALNVEGESRPEWNMVARNVNFLRRWGPELAASHKRADFGIIDPTGSFPQDSLSASDIERVSLTLQRMERATTLTKFSSELLDPQNQPLEQLERDALVFLPVFDPEKPQFQLSENSQKEIVEYVRAGGTLVLYLGRPSGDSISELWKSAPAPPAGASSSAIHNRWKFGQGEVIECTKDFTAGLALNRSLAENLAQPESPFALGLFREIVAAAGINPAVKVGPQIPGFSGVIASELVENEGTLAFGRRNGPRGFLSVTNLEDAGAFDATLDVLSPAAPARGTADSYLRVHVVVPPRDSLLLPLNQPICFNDPNDAPCGDSLVQSGAEFLGALREDHTLELLLYVPAKEDLVLQLASQPSHVNLDDSTPESQWEKSTGQLRVTVPRGPAPSYLRLLKIDMTSAPHVPKLTKEGKPSPSELTVSVFNATRLPVSFNQSMRTYPPLIVAEPGKMPGLVVAMFNFNSEYERDVDVTVDGPLKGSDFFRIAPQNNQMENIKLKGPGKDLSGIPVAPDGLIHETILVKDDKDRRVLPVTFLPLRAAATTNYKYDFDRDGADEWVLENSGLRLIVSPESGGRIIALVDKTGSENLSTSVGLARDNFLFTPNPEDISPRRAPGLYGLFNRPYSAKWSGDDKNPSLALHYDAPDVFPAGASIDKTIQLESPATVRVDYLVKLNAVPSGTSPADHPQGFVAVNSFPVTLLPDHPPQFCWDEAAEPSAPEKPAADSAAAAKPAPHCAGFVAGGKPIEVPAGVKLVEVRSPEQPVITFEWECANECARLEIELKNYSALFRLAFPPLQPGGKAGSYTTRIQARVQP